MPPRKKVTIERKTKSIDTVEMQFLMFFHFSRQVVQMIQVRLHQHPVPAVPVLVVILKVLVLIVIHQVHQV